MHVPGVIIQLMFAPPCASVVFVLRMDGPWLSRQKDKGRDGCGYELIALQIKNTQKPTQIMTKTVYIIT